MRLIKASAGVAVTVLCLIIASIVTAFPASAYYGYPAPRHSDAVAREASSAIAALNVLKAWLKRLGEPVRQVNNSDLAVWANRILKKVTNPSKYALLTGGIQLKALKLLAGFNPSISAEDIVAVINASIRYVVKQGIVNSTGIMWNALNNKNSCQAALNYVALSMVRISKNGSSAALEALSAIVAFQEALSTHHYGDARTIMRETAENTSIMVAAYMACQLPSRTAGSVTQPPATGESQVNNEYVVSVEDMLKAVAVLERLGPKAVEVLGKVPVLAVINAVSKVPLKMLRNMSVDELVNVIENASPNNTALNPNIPTAPPSNMANVTPREEGPNNNLINPASAPRWRPPGLRYRIEPRFTGTARKAAPLKNPTASQSIMSGSYAAIKVVGTLVNVVKSVNIPSAPASTMSEGWWSLTAPEVRNVKTVAMAGTGSDTVSAYLTPFLTTLLSSLVLAALILALRARHERIPPKALTNVKVDELPDVVREFWEAITVISRALGTEVRANLTHREIVNLALRDLGIDVRVALLKLATLYEGVRYAGVKVTREMSSLARDLLQEVMTALEAK